MSSGEWDLGALRALEEVEKKEFLALSQKNLFDPPSPPAAGTLLQQTQQLKQQQFQQKLTYAQLYPHALKLPTINECNLIAAARRRQLLLQQQQQQIASGSNTGGRRLKFARALSLSAHSLTGRGNVNGKKIITPKPKSSSSHVSAAGSPTFPYSASPVYTPPPVRRCATLHHTQPVRKAFKTLQQLEKQKQDRKKEVSVSLRRISGTNKTYWKYGVNSTAASIIGQRKKLNSSIAEIESNTSDELGSEATNDFSGNGSHSNSEQWQKSYVDCDDSATDPGSCSVPLASDSVEMMRLMLSAATAAVTTHPITTQAEVRTAEHVPKDVDYLLNGRPFDVVRSINKAATSGAACKPNKAVTTSTPMSTNKLNGEKSILQSCYGSTFLGLPSRYPLKLSTSSFSPERETVACKALPEQWRRKSFSNNGGRAVTKLRRGCSLTDEDTAHEKSYNSNSCSHSSTKSSIITGNPNNCKMLKTSSLDMSIELDTRLNIEGDTSSLQQSTLMNNLITENKETTAMKRNTHFDTKPKQYHHSNLSSTGAEARFQPIMGRKADVSNNAKNCSGLSSSTENIKGPVLPLHHQQIDDELEQHIKHCSCSCNHMGYGNSMDYQLNRERGKMELRPLSYEEMCQMELMQRSGAAGPNMATVVPIMMIPTSMVPPGTAILTAAAPPPQKSVDNDAENSEHIYQFQPTHIFSTSTSNSDQMAQHQQNPPGILSGGNTLLQPQTLLLPTIEQQQKQQLQQQQSSHLQQHPQTQQQIPQTQLQQTLPPTLNIIYTGTITTASRTPDTIESATLPRSFAPANIDVSVGGAGISIGDESDFEGSECGGSVSGTTCIPHFRFGGCSMMLQPMLTASNTPGSGHPQQHQHQHQHLHPHHQQQQQQQHHNQHQEPEAVGCAAFSQMMGTFASAAGGAMNSARFSGTLGPLTGVGTGLSNTLGRNRRASGCHSGSMRQAAKRVSFKGDNLSREGLKDLQEIHSHSDGDSVDGTDGLSNCSYMHFNNFMDYQTTGFGGLPDVTEHSNARRTLSHQNSISNSDSGGEIASIEKSKTNFGDIRPPPLAHPANIKRKSKAAHQAVNDSCARVNRFKLRRCSCAIFLTLVAALCLLTIAAMLAYQHFMAPSRNSHAQRLRIVRRILKEVPLVDGHNNFAWNVRKYAQNSLELVHMRQDPNAATLWTRPTWAQTDMDRLKQGLVGAQMWSAYVPCEALGLDAVQIAIEQIDIIRRLTDMFNLDTVLVSSAADILTARKHGQMASLIGIKGGHAIGSSLAVLRSFYSVGARALSLTHRCDLSWAGSSASESESGLSAFGKSVIREMNRLGMMVDLSYSSDATARDVLQVTRAPVIFSHSAARQLCNSTHNIPDDILRLVADNGGLIMVSFDPEDVACGQQAYIGDVVEHIKYIRAIAGVQHVGLGAGYDGIEIPPIGLEDVSKYPELLATLLQDHNWSEQDIAMLAGKNFLRILETVENVRDYWKRADIQPLEQTEPQPKPQCPHKSS